MPKYYGCPCEGCTKPLTLQDDIVVCPDCGAPYHRSCYEKLGQCLHKPAHAGGYEWKFPYQESELRTCPSCREQTLRSEANCRCCGAVLPPENASEPQNPTVNDGRDSFRDDDDDFDYESLYRRFEQTVANPLHRNLRAAFGKDELIDGIPSQDWMDYIGSAAPAYLADYSRMQLQGTKVSISFSALLFGPFYFFYRKAWKPAFAFLAAELILSVPSLINLMQLTGSTMAPAMSDSTLTMLSHIMTILSFLITLARGLYGKWLYRKSAAEHIKRIRKDFPENSQRRAVLAAQGGVSIAAVFGAFVLLMVLGASCTLLLGPDVDVLLALLG